MSRAGLLNCLRLVLAGSHRVCPGRRPSGYRRRHRERVPILLAPTTQLSSRRPRVRPGIWPRARRLDLSLQLAGGRMARPPGLPGSQSGPPSMEGGGGSLGSGGGGGGAAGAAVSAGTAQGPRLPH